MFEGKERDALCAAAPPLGEHTCAHQEGMPHQMLGLQGLQGLQGQGQCPLAELQAHVLELEDALFLECECSRRRGAPPPPPQSMTTPHQQGPGPLHPQREQRLSVTSPPACEGKAVQDEMLACEGRLQPLQPQAQAQQQLEHTLLTSRERLEEMWIEHKAQLHARSWGGGHAVGVGGGGTECSHQHFALWEQRLPQVFQELQQQVGVLLQEQVREISLLKQANKHLSFQHASGDRAAPPLQHICNTAAQLSVQHASGIGLPQATPTVKQQQASHALSHASELPLQPLQLHTRDAHTDRCIDCSRVAGVRSNVMEEQENVVVERAEVGGRAVGGLGHGELCLTDLAAQASVVAAVAKDRGIPERPTHSDRVLRELFLLQQTNKPISFQHASGSRAAIQLQHSCNTAATQPSFQQASGNVSPSDVVIGKRAATELQQSCNRAATPPEGPAHNERRGGNGVTVQGDGAEASRERAHQQLQAQATASSRQELGARTAVRDSPTRASVRDSQASSRSIQAVDEQISAAGKRLAEAKARVASERDLRDGLSRRGKQNLEILFRCLGEWRTKTLHRRYAAVCTAQVPYRIAEREREEERELEREMEWSGGRKRCIADTWPSALHRYPYLSVCLSFCGCLGSI
jgi:hypothetical protein